MRELWKKILHALEAGQAVELVSILASSGSTPRGAGAVMAVFSNGESAGTIGGGAVEYEAQRAAAALLASGGDDVKDYRFVLGDAASLGMVCGGDVTVQFQFLPGGEGPCTQAIRSLAAAFSGSRDTWLLRRIEDVGRCAGGAFGKRPRVPGRLAGAAGGAGREGVYLWWGPRVPGAGAGHRGSGFPPRGI